MAPRVSFDVLFEPRHPEISTVHVSVALPMVEDARAQAREIGVPSIRGEIVEACKNTREYQNYVVLQSQIEAAEAKVLAANKTFERAKAAKVLLQDNPEPGLADKLRGIIAQIEQAEKDRQCAEADLAQIRGLRHRHWSAAANAVASPANPIDHPKNNLLRARRDELRSRLDLACMKVREILEKSVAAHIEPLVKELPALKIAVDDWNAQAIELKESVFAELMGPRPDGVTLNAYNMYVLADHPKPATPVV